MFLATSNWPGQARLWPPCVFPDTTAQPPRTVFQLSTSRALAQKSFTCLQPTTLPASSDLLPSIAASSQSSINASVGPAPLTSHKFSTLYLFFSTSLSSTLSRQACPSLHKKKPWSGSLVTYRLLDPVVCNPLLAPTAFSSSGPGPSLCFIPTPNPVSILENGTRTPHHLSNTLGLNPQPKGLGCSWLT